jgi:hypothetical protein
MSDPVYRSDRLAFMSYMSSASGVFRGNPLALAHIIGRWLGKAEGLGNMRRQAVLLAVLGVTLVSCVGVHGPTGNYTGGIIPWSAEAERDALDIAQRNCSKYNEYAVITSIRREYGDYIVYECQWQPPRHLRRHQS